MLKISNEKLDKKTDEELDELTKLNGQMLRLVDSQFASILNEK